MAKAVLKIFRPMSEDTERTWPERVERSCPARVPRSPKVNCQLVIGHIIVDLGGNEISSILIKLRAIKRQGK